MKLTDTSAKAAEKILAAFQNPESLPRALAPVFISRGSGRHCDAWSWTNQLLVALSGYSDARGYRQWQDVGRTVRKGQKAFYILAPLTKTFRRENADGSESTGRATYGFRGQPVFGLEQTEGEPLPVDPERENLIASLPFVDVARSWDLAIGTYAGEGARGLGRYRRGEAIALGVHNLSTWAHELIHAADDKLGNLTEPGQHWRSEVVAELGGAILLTAAGLEHDADLGGCWRYVGSYAAEAGLDPVAACLRVLKRTCDAVDLVLREAHGLAGLDWPAAPGAARNAETADSDAEPVAA